MAKSPHTNYATWVVMKRMPGTRKWAMAETGLTRCAAGQLKINLRQQGYEVKIEGER